jgi:hypothetical protein
VKGPIPLEVGEFSHLAELVLNSNELDGGCMIRATGRPQISLIQFFSTGEIPVSLGNCVNLTVLRLDVNKLQGKCSIRATGRPQIPLIHFF